MCPSARKPPRRRAQQARSERTIAVVLEYLLPAARQRWEAYAEAPPPGLKLVFRAPDELIFTLTDDVPASPAQHRALPGPG